MTPDRPLEARREEKDPLAAPRYQARFLLPVVLVMFLCAFDAVATLLHMDKGIADEGNPLMASLIGWGPLYFLCIKYLVTLLGVLVLLIYAHRPKAQATLWAIAGLYLLLTLFHGMIIWRYW